MNLYLPENSRSIIFIISEITIELRYRESRSLRNFSSMKRMIYRVKLGGRVLIEFAEIKRVNLSLA